MNGHPPYRYRHGWIPLAAAAFRDPESGGGFTMNTKGKVPTKGFMVSNEHGEVVHDAGKFDPERHIDQHAAANIKALKEKNAYQGAWSDNGKVYLDVSHNHADERSAADAALRNKQLAVADLGRIGANDWDNAFPSTEDITKRALAGLSAKEDEIQMGSRTVAKIGGKYVVSNGADGPVSFNTPRQAAKYLANLPEHKHQEAGMSLSFITPAVHQTGDIELASQDGKLAFWKQILPKAGIDYTAKDGSRQHIDFDEQYLTDLATLKAVDKIGFLLADAENRHTMDPERWRGDVVQMEVREDGLYGKIVFPNPTAAAAVIDNPNLGVSARIRENVQRSDGSTLARGIIHVLGTLDPQVSGMAPWQPTDLSNDEDEVLDLSEMEYTDMADKKEAKKKALADYTPDEIEAFTEEELDAFLAEFVPDFTAYTETSTSEEEVEDQTKDETKVLAGAGADMATKVQADIELANQAAAQANARAAEALKRLADAQWQSARESYMDAGVPPHLLDLAAPVLNRPSEMVIDLSNEDSEDVNVTAVVKGLLDACKGMVDLSNEMGHNGHFAGGEDPDQAMLDAWAKQF